MSYSLVIGGAVSVPLASLTGWSDFKRWSESLSVDEYAEVIHLVEHAISQDLDKLHAELLLALKLKTPKSQEVIAVAKGLLQALEDRAPDAGSVFVTDGVVEMEDDGSEEDDDWESGYEPDEDEDEGDEE